MKTHTTKQTNMKQNMNTTELKKLAENAAENGASIYHEFYAAANPAAILKLLAINGELVEALKGFVENQMTVGQRYTNEGQAMLDALAKAEGGEL